MQTLHFLVFFSVVVVSLASVTGRATTTTTTAATTPSGHGDDAATTTTNYNDNDNICSRNATIGRSVVQSMNLSWPGLEAAAAAAAEGDLGRACSAIGAYYRKSNTSSSRRLPPVPPSTRLAGGAADAIVFNDTFKGFPSPSTPCRIPRNEDGGLDDAAIPTVHQKHSRR